ncbi:MAG: NAD-dependent epimerase/dehydratase family protein, partial [Halobacteriales archaeon]|nr:NAD-dependent epimerase/dehydratase family protein [Halobacteriales archaeon]
MKVLVAGATRTLGRPTTAALAQQGHAVVAMTRDPARAAPIRAHCKGIAVAEPLDERAMRNVLHEHRPDAVLHLLTALPPGGGAKASD